MTDMNKDVNTFIDACDQKPSPDNIELYLDLIEEEYAEFNDAVIASEKFHFIAKKSESKNLRAWSLYLIGNCSFQTSNMNIASQSFKEVIDFDGVINYRIYFDALAGLILLNSLKGNTKTAESLLITMELMTAKLKNSQFRLYTRSVKARVNLHRGLGSKS